MHLKTKESKQAAGCPGQHLTFEDFPLPFLSSSGQNNHAYSVRSTVKEMTLGKAKQTNGQGFAYCSLFNSTLSGKAWKIFWVPHNRIWHLFSYYLESALYFSDIRVSQLRSSEYKSIKQKGKERLKRKSSLRSELRLPVQLQEMGTAWRHELRTLIQWVSVAGYENVC